MHALDELGQRISEGFGADVVDWEAVVCPHTDEYQIGI